MAKVVNVVVKLVIDDEADVDEVLANMDYDFTHEDDIIDTEIVSVYDMGEK